MKFLWIVFTFVLMGNFVLDYAQPEPFSLSFFLCVAFLVAFQILHIRLLEALFGPKVTPMALRQMDINAIDGIIEYKLDYKEVSKKYPKKLIHEVIIAESRRMDEALAKYSQLLPDKDFSVFVSTDEKATTIIYVIKTLTPRAKEILCDVYKSFDLMGLM
jgi:hypothetical protein